MKSFLAVLRGNWLGLVLIPIIVGCAMYLWSMPALADIDALIKKKAYAEADEQLDELHRHVGGWPGDQRGLYYWQRAQLVLRKNLEYSTLTIGDIRDVIGLLKQSRESYLEAGKTVPSGLFGIWLEAIEAFKGVHGHREALVELAELARVRDNPPAMLLAQAKIEQERPGGRIGQSMQMIERYLALPKLTRQERRAGLLEQARVYQLRARNLALELSNPTARVVTFAHQLGLAQRISNDYAQERKVREVLLKEPSSNTERLGQMFELGRVTFREAEVRSQLLHYWRRSQAARDPKQVEGLQAQLKQGLTEAMTHLRAYVALADPGPELAEAYYLIGESARLLGQFDTALKAFRKLEKMEGEPQVVAIYLSMLGKARVSIEQRAWDRFEKAVPKLSETAAGGPEQQYELGRLYELYRDRRIADYRDRLARDLESARQEARGLAFRDALRRSAQEHIRATRQAWNPRAADHYIGGTSNQIRTRAADAALRALDLFNRVGNSVGSIQACDRYLASGVSDPRVSEVLLQKGQLLVAMGLGPEAIAAFKENIRRYPNSLYSYRSLLAIGDAEADSGETQRALTVYRRIRQDTRFGPDTRVWRNALYREGVILAFAGLAKAGKERDAMLLQSVALLGQYNARYPEDPQTRRGLFYQGLAWMGMGKWARAEAIFGRLAETRVYAEEPDVAERRRIYRLSNFLHGLAYLRAIRDAKEPPGPKQLARAIDILETAIERFDETAQSVWASSALVGLYQEAGMNAQATKIGRRAVWLASKVGSQGGFDSQFWTRWIRWKMAVLLR